MPCPRTLNPFHHQNAFISTEDRSMLAYLPEHSVANRTAGRPGLFRQQLPESGSDHPVIGVLL